MHDNLNIGAAGYLTKEKFVVFHEKLVTLLKETYEKQALKFPKGKTREVLLKDGSKKQLVLPPVWMYGKGKKPDSAFITINDLYTKSQPVQDFISKINKMKGVDGGFFVNSHSFENRIYEFRRAFFPPVGKPSIEEKYIDGPLDLFGVFLLVEPTLDLPEIQEKYWRTDKITASLNRASNQWSIDAYNPQQLEYHHYLVFYFSVIYFSVKFFVLSLSTKSIGKKGNYSVYKMEENGLHNLAENDQAEFKGEALKSGEGYFFASLKNDAKNRFLNLMWNMDDEIGVENIKAFRGALQGVSKTEGRRILSAEVLFYQISKDKKEEIITKRKNNTPFDLTTMDIFEEEDEYRKICLYLSAQRRTFASKTKNISQDDVFSLTAKRASLEKFSFLLGKVYKILHFGLKEEDQKKSLILSKLKVRADGTAKLTTVVSTNFDNPKVRTFNCVLNLVGFTKVCVYAYPQNNLQISNFAILNFGRSIGDEKIYEGIFSSIGFDNQGLLGNYMVFKWETKDEDFSPERIMPSQVDDFLQSDDNRILFEKLQQLDKEKNG